MKKGGGSEPMLTSEEMSSLSLDTLADLPEEVGVLSDELIGNLVALFFRLLNDTFFSFLQEQVFLDRYHQKTLPKCLLYAVCAASARYLLPRCSLMKIPRAIGVQRKSCTPIH